MEPVSSLGPALFPLPPASVARKGWPSSPIRGTALPVNFDRFLRELSHREWALRRVSFLQKSQPTRRRGRLPTSAYRQRRSGAWGVNEGDCHAHKTMSKRDHYADDLPRLRSSNAIEARRARVRRQTSGHPYVCVQQMHVQRDIYLCLGLTWPTSDRSSQRWMAFSARSSGWVSARWRKRHQLPHCQVSMSRIVH